LAWSWKISCSNGSSGKQSFGGACRPPSERGIKGGHGKLPWQTSGSASFDTDTWELYNIDKDFSQAHDLAKKQSKKLRELQDLFMAEAAKYNVLPLDDRFAERADANLKPSYIRGMKRFVYLPGTVRISEPSSPNTKNIDHTLAAEVGIPNGGAEGVLICCGGMSAGYTLFMKDGKLHWEHNWFEEARFKVSSTERIPAGHRVLSAEVKVDKENQFGVGGKVILRMGEKVIGEGRFEKQVAFRFTVEEGFDIGCDTVTPVSDQYESPFPFTGKIKRVMVYISPKAFQEEAKRALAKVAMATQ
jgi:hypothetical protein